MLLKYHLQDETRQGRKSVEFWMMDKEAACIGGLSFGEGLSTVTTTTAIIRLCIKIDCLLW